MAQKPIDIKPGQRNNKLVALEFAGIKKTAHSSRHLWKFQCDCGNQVIKTVSEVTRGAIKSCGCLLGLRSNAKRDTKGAFLPGEKEPLSMEIWKDKYMDGCPYETFLKMSQLPCHYCGTTLSCTRADRRIKYQRDTFSYNGLDRLDSAKDHSPDNIVTCCWTCNKAKSNRSYQEFIDWIQLVHRHLLS